MEYKVIEEGKFRYLETGTKDKECILLLHGLFGALSNFQGIMEHFSTDYNVVVPMLPIYEMPLKSLSVTGLVNHVDAFIDFKGYSNILVLGNSLGGHIAQLYTMKRPEKVKALILTGSSGLFENAMGSTFPKRGNYEFIKKKTEDTFYNPETATKELVDEVYDIVNDRSKAIRVIVTAKSAVRHNLEDKIGSIKCPTLLIWGKQDNVTPAFVGEKFHALLPNSELFFVEECGHAPMMEKPDKFNEIMSNFMAGLK